ncbi:MAG: LysM peptidoglycan-binding domain-containing protein [Saprospirales bacterium]|nr:LysM peptidoglycan-binding domain-containing protein [Saprospirales bacterium]
MKQTFFTLLSLCSAGMLTAQQTPMYILFNASCMDQLEYRYVYAGSTVVSYSIRPTANEQYILTTGTGGITSPTLPKTAVNCREYALNDQFLNDVNNLSRQVYIVHQQSKGYLMVPVISATQVIRSGPYYLFRAPNYSFAIDTSNQVYESNIATGSSNWYIYFNGLKIRGCYYEYSFKREPTKVGQERSEFDFVPGIGISTERTGKTAAEAENNQYRLVKVNGMALEDFIVTHCQGKTAAPTTAPLSQYTPTIDYTTGVVREGDKEMASQPAATSSPYATSALPRLINCPEPPGEGYHIVQPKETLNGISRAYGIPVKSLIAWNNIKDPDQIQVCQKIWLRQPPAGAPASKGVSPEPSRSPDAAGPTVRRQDVYWQSKSDIGINSAQPAVYATYLQDKPATSAWDPRGATTPVTYSYNTPAATPAYNPAAKPLVHTVQKGENLYGIGQRYGLTEAEMRRLNNYPATGAIVLQPGMQVFVSDCCPGQGAVAPQGYYAPTTTYPELGKQPATAQPYYPGQTYTQPTSTGTYPELYSAPATTQPVTPATYYQPGAQPVAPAPTGKQPSYFQEYIVREGDNITSVAIKFKVNAQELALVNNKEVNETLIAGQRLLIPRI